MQVAVLAHYDPGSTWDANFLAILAALRGIAGRTLVVTTSAGMPPLPPDLDHVTVVSRPNVGYDFYSYRVGVYLAGGMQDVDGLFLLNSSLLLLDAERFKTLLREMADATRHAPVCGVTESNQFSWHLQSYLLHFDLRRLPAGWLDAFFSRVEPLNTKFEVVLAYEIGLGRALRDAGIAAEALFRPTLGQRVAGTLGFLRTLLRENGLRTLGPRTVRDAWRDVNWTHFGACDLARRFGIVKAEFLRGNPHRLPQAPVIAECSACLVDGVRMAVDRTRDLYARGASGLTELKLGAGVQGTITQIIESKAPRHADARIAVVVHLYYLDLLDEILDDLTSIVEPLDLYVTTPFEAGVRPILNGAQARGWPVSIVLCRNQGRDVGPFVSLFRTGRLDRYDAVLKLHSKKSRYSDQGERWRRQLYAPLCGDSMTALRSIALIRKGCGVVGPGRFFLTHPDFWGANRDSLALILRACGIPVPASGPELAFFAGTMFWFAPDALAAIHRCQGDALAFESENGKQDGTLAHAWERAFCLIAHAAGRSASTLELGGREVCELDHSSNRVPVLNTGG